MSRPASPDPWTDLAVRLGPAALATLAEQGSVSAELRRGGATTFKLRFRQDGRQRVVYVGSDPARAEHVRGGLRALQAARDLARRFARLKAQARAAMTLARDRLAPDLAAAGYHFHGFTPRRTRSAKLAGRAGAVPSAEVDHGQSQ
jgi:hypothetical protein